MHICTRVHSLQVITEGGVIWECEAKKAEAVSLKARFDILVSIPGVSQITAFTLLIEMPELGELDEKAAAALSALAPMSRQSGRWTGRAFIAGGRAIE